MIERAIEIAARVHRGQTDKAGEPYILHALEVMNMVSDYSSDAMIVAVLHDVLEDFEGTPLQRLELENDLEKLFGPEIYMAVVALTKRDNESYDQYIERVAENYLARLVKMADLTHNMDPRRIPANQIVDKDFARWDKYRRALIRLERE